MKLIVSALAALVCASTASTAYAACDDPTRPAVDWSRCWQSDASLHGADLSGAKKKGIWMHLYRTHPRPWKIGLNSGIDHTAESKDAFLQALFEWTNTGPQ